MDLPPQESNGNTQPLVDNSITSNLHHDNRNVQTLEPQKPGKSLKLPLVLTPRDDVEMEMDFEKCLPTNSNPSTPPSEANQYLITDIKRTLPRSQVQVVKEPRTKQEIVQPQQEFHRSQLDGNNHFREYGHVLPGTHDRQQRIYGKDLGGDEKNINGNCIYEDTEEKGSNPLSENKMSNNCDDGDVGINKVEKSNMKPVSVTGKGGDEKNINGNSIYEDTEEKGSNPLSENKMSNNCDDGDVGINKVEKSNMKPVSVTGKNNISVSNIERIAAKYDFSVENVPGDGNCMFHAIALQLPSNKLKSKIGEEKSKELRSKIVEFLKSHDTTPFGEKYSSFLLSWRENEKQITWSDYLTSMDKSGCYGDEIILEAVSHCFNVRILVLSTASPERFLKYNSSDISEDSTVYLGFIDESDHYVRLQPESSEFGVATNQKHMLGGKSFPPSYKDNVLAPKPLQRDFAIDPSTQPSESNHQYTQVAGIKKQSQVRKIEDVDISKDLETFVDIHAKMTTTQGSITKLAKKPSLVKNQLIPDACSLEIKDNMDVFLNRRKRLPKVPVFPSNSSFTADIQNQSSLPYGYTGHEKMDTSD